MPAPEFFAGAKRLNPGGASSGNQTEMNGRFDINKKLSATTVKSTEIKKVNAAAEDEVEYNTLLEEDFSLMTKGSEEAPDPTMYPENYISTGRTEMPDELFHTPGWFGSGVHQAGGMISLELAYEREATEDDVLYGDAENVGDIIKVHDGGTILTPFMKMPGKIRATFKAKAVNYPVFFTYYIYPESHAEDTTLKPEDGWQEFEFIFENNSAEDCCFGINSAFMSQGYLMVDDIRIESEKEFVNQVNGAKADRFTTDGFTLSWDEVNAAKDYLITLEGESPADEGEFELSTSFEEDMTEEGLCWKGEISESEEGEQYDGEHVLTLKNGDWIEFDGKGSLISSFVFAMKSNNEKSDRTGILYCDVYDGSEWHEERTSTYMSRLEDDWYLYESIKEDAILGLFGFSYANNFKKIRFRFSAPENESVAIDKVSYKVDNPLEIKEVCTDLVTDVTSYTFTGLDHGNYEYYYVIKARGENGKISKPTPRNHALGIPAPVALEATDINTRGSFTANWQAAPKAENYEVNIFAYDEMTEDTYDYVLLSENFSKTEGQAPEGSYLDLGNYNISPLDEYCDNPGWTGSGTIIGNSELGCLAGDDMFGEYYELYSPEMDLDNAGGKYSVTVKGITEESDYLTVQGDENDYNTITTEGGVPFEATVTLEGGCKDTRLMIYTANNSAFALSHVEVSQNLSKGDKVYLTLSKEECEAPETSFRVNGLDTSERLHFAYSLRSKFNYNNIVVKSDESERIPVNLDLTGVDVIDDAANGISMADRTFTISGEDGSLVEIFNAAGIKVASAAVAGGNAVVTVSDAGLYIVKTGDKAYSFMVK